MSGPVFRKEGTVVGMILSCSDLPDSVNCSPDEKERVRVAISFSFEANMDGV